MKVVIELPGIKAVSRNQTSGHYTKYRERLMEAEQWMVTYGRRFEHHFTRPVDVLIEAYYDVRGVKKIADAPNIDDKIFTDTLNRYKPVGKKGFSAVERNVWFIEDDNPKFLRYVIKRSIPSDKYKIVITITEVEQAIDNEHLVR